jgi:chromate transporter
MAIKLALPLRRSPLSVAIARVVLVAIAVLKLPMVPTMLVMAPLSIFIMMKAGA